MKLTSLIKMKNILKAGNSKLKNRKKQITLIMKKSKKIQNLINKFNKIKFKKTKQNSQKNKIFYLFQN